MFHELLQTTRHLKHPHETVRGRERRLQRCGIARLPDVHLRRPGGLPVPDREGQGGDPVPHRPLPPRAPTRQGPERADPRRTQAGLGVDRTTPARARRRRTGRTRPPRLRPRLDRPAVPGRAARLARRGRGHPGLLGEDLHPRHQAPRAGGRREARRGDPLLRCRRHPRRARAQAARPRHRTRHARRGAEGERRWPGVSSPEN